MNADPMPTDPADIGAWRAWLSRGDDPDEAAFWRELQESMEKARGYRRGTDGESDE